MTPDKQNITIAEACGWKKLEGGYYQDPRFSWRRIFPYQMPEYLNDLNAMHEAEKVLLAKKEIPNIYSYLLEIEKITGSPDDCTYLVLCATASQRAEAFLRTLGLWEE